MSVNTAITRRSALAGVLASPIVLRYARAAETLKIGAINPLTGPLAIYGDEVTRGYELAADQANAAGGAIGRQIQVIRGDATSPQQAISTVDQLATQQNVDVFTGTYVSAIANSGSDAAMRYQKLWWETNALAKELTERGLPNFIRSGANGDAFATVSVQAITDLIAPALKKSPAELSVWLEHEDSIYGTSIVATQQKLLAKAGAKGMTKSAHPARATDLTDSVLRAKRANPDVWVNTGYVPDGNLLLRLARDQGFKPRALLWVGTGDTPETLEALGPEYLEGVCVVGFTRTDVSPEYGPGAADYLTSYKAKYNRDPIAPQGMSAFVGMQMLLEAIKAAGSPDPEKVRAAVAKMDKPLQSYATGYGARFDDNFQNTRAFPTVIQWQAGKQVTVFPKAAMGAGTTLKNVPRA
jgi:branched-chain amino acid transport system substrate-binding protein